MFVCDKMEAKFVAFFLFFTQSNLQLFCPLSTTDAIYNSAVSCTYSFYVAQMHSILLYRTLLCTAFTFLPCPWKKDEAEDIDVWLMFLFQPDYGSIMSCRSADTQISGSAMSSEKGQVPAALRGKNYWRSAGAGIVLLSLWVMIYCKPKIKNVWWWFSNSGIMFINLNTPR